MSAVGWEKGHGRTAVWLAKAGRRAAAASEKRAGLCSPCVQVVARAGVRSGQAQSARLVKWLRLAWALAGKQET